MARGFVSVDLSISRPSSTPQFVAVRDAGGCQPGFGILGDPAPAERTPFFQDARAWGDRLEPAERLADRVRQVVPNFLSGGESDKTVPPGESLLGRVERALPSGGLSPIRHADHPAGAALQNARANHRRANIRVPRQFPDGADVGPGFDRVRREAVPKGVATHPLGQSARRHRFLHAWPVRTPAPLSSVPSGRRFRGCETAAARRRRLRPTLR